MGSLIRFFKSAITLPYALLELNVSEEIKLLKFIEAMSRY